MNYKLTSNIVNELALSKNFSSGPQHLVKPANAQYEYLGKYKLVWKLLCSESYVD